MRIVRIDIEREFNSVVRDCGGVVVQENLPYSPTFPNADYVFHSEKIVAELKCLTEDNVYSEENLEKGRHILEMCHSKGIIDSPTLDLDSWKRLPVDAQTKLYEIFTRNLKRRIAKANRQIRETKRELHLTDYNGLLFLANDGVVSLPPAAFIHATQMTLRNHFHEIRHFVFFTSNVFTALRGVSVPVLFWIYFHMEDGKPIDKEFTERLGRAWSRHCSTITSIPTVEGELQDIEGFWSAKHINK